jgi:hypothetical protein
MLEIINKKKIASFHQVYPILSIEEGKVILKDGRVAIGFRLHPVEMEKWTAPMYENFNTVFTGALSILPQGSVVQKTDIYYDRPIRQIIRRMLTLKQKPRDTFTTVSYFFIKAICLSPFRIES